MHRNFTEEILARCRDVRGGGIIEPVLSGP
jgi:hypothetical protein